ncbi:MAG: hypothetical protein L6416_07720 [Candidatus Omnitrophica bacterium]|nr:hypothetical protein [Candidatus Omnitrophota bacterium]
MEKTQKSKRNKAQAMVVVFIYISVVSLLGIYMMVYAANLHNMAIREINHAKAFYAGEAALIQSFSQLCNGGAAAVNMTFGNPATPITVAVAGTNIGNGYIRIRATVSGWQEW